MGILSRPRFLPQQRLDLEDVNALLAALRTDSKLYTKQFLSGQNLIYKGFTVTGIGLKSATVAMADATLIIPQNSNDFSWFTSSPTEPNVTIPDADLTDGTRNYVEIELSTENNTPLTKAFWDPEANSGLGSEFNQIVETITDLKTNFVVSTGGFSGLPDRLPLCIIDVDGSGNIKTILDRRTLFGRLAKPSDLDNEFAWGTKLEPTYALTMTGVSGVFVAGEQITINTETAKVTTGGTSAIAFNEPTGVNFFPGSTVTGLLSGATGTVNTVAESFTGVDKNLKCQKDINDALMTELKLVKGTRFWWQDPSSSLVGIVKFLESILVQNTATAAFAWDGSELSITDDNVTPGNDTLGYIRIMGRGDDLALTREDGTGGTSTIAIADGEVLYIKIPATGSRTYSGVGSGDTNFQLVDIASYVSSDETYWLAYREGNRLYIRGYGEMEPGEEVNIGDPELEDILASIAANLASANQDRTMKLVEGGTWSLNLDGDELTLSEDAYIEIPGLDNDRNTISADTISLPNPNSVAYIEVNRSGVGASVRPVTVADADAVTLNDNIVIIARRVSDGVLVGLHSFLLKAGEMLELDGALAEINRYMGQLKIKRHETDLDKARINSADSLLLNGTTLSQIIGNFLLDFGGAVIDFTTGDIFEADGTTPLGSPFTPQVIPAGEYFWYGISLLPGDVNVQNMQEATVQVDLADASDAVQADAPKPVISGTIKLGAILVRNNGGNIEVVDLKPLGVGSGSGGGSGQGASFDAELRTYLKLSDYEFVEANLFPVDEDDKIDPSSTGAYSPATRNFEMTTGQTMVSADLLDPDFIAANRPLAKARIILRYAEGLVDTNPTVEIRKNGGSYETVTMNRIGNTDTYDGEIELDAANGTALQMRVTASMDSEIFGYGVMYDTTFVSVPLGQQKYIHPETFLGDLNKTTFTLPFLPDPSTLVVYDKTRGQSYIYDPANTFAISGNDIVFVADFFNFPGETIKLEFRQIVGNGFDNSDQNAVAIAEIQQNLLDIGEELLSISDSMIMPKIVVPNTTISGRAQMFDLSQTLKPQMGIDRMMAQNLVPLYNEFGPNGEPVYALSNDFFGQIRFVGQWTSAPTTDGVRLFTSVVSDYLEVTFYGTGLNILGKMDGRDWRASVDGGAEGSNFTTNASTVLATRNYAQNTIVNVVSGLSLGFHTVKIRHVSGNVVIYGFEFLNESTTIRLNPGSQLHKGRRLTKPTASTIAYDSGFESGTLGTKGGTVLVYQKSDGSVAHSVTPTDAAQQNLTNANHDNEEIARVYNFREFGAARDDDFSLATPSNATRAFTLDDGTTTLIGSGVQSMPVTGRDAIGPGVLNGYVTLTFVGTGLDFTVNANDAGVYGASYQILVDGTDITGGGMTAAALFGRAGRTGTKRVKVVSGLPYGTHIVKIIITVAALGDYFNDFTVYRPKTPTLPNGAVALQKYCIMGDFVANSVGSPSSTSLDTISTGVLRKTSTRELTYVGSWSIGSVDATWPSGFSVSSTTVGNYVEYTFFGTGFDLRMFMSTAGTGNVQLTLDGSITDFSPYTTSFVGPAGTGFTAATGIIDGSASAGSGFSSTMVTGLPLGKHTIRATISSTGLVMSSLDIVTPVHILKENGPFVLQNTSPVGNQSMLDLRKFSKKDVPTQAKKSQSLGVRSNPTTSNTTMLPSADLSTIFTTEKGGPIEIKWQASFTNNQGAGSGRTTFQVAVNGNLYGTSLPFDTPNAASTICVSSGSCIVDVPPGTHKIDIYWNSNAGISTLFATNRMMNVREVEK